MPRWPDGSQHTISWSQHLSNVAQALAHRQAAAAQSAAQAQAAARSQAAAAQAAAQAHTQAAAAQAGPVTFQPDSGYNNDVDFADRQRTQALGNIGEDEQKTKYDFGFDDPTNPFSRVQEAKKLYLANSNRSTTAMASAGQITGGAYQRALERNRHNEEQGSANLRAQYEAAMTDMKRRRQGADNAYEAAKLDAWQKAMARQGA
jgi:hypothetical protein